LRYHGRRFSYIQPTRRATSNVEIRDDFVRSSFLDHSMALIAVNRVSSAERDQDCLQMENIVDDATLVTLIAAVLLHARRVWVATGSTPTVIPYIVASKSPRRVDDRIHLILAAIAKVPAAVFWRLAGGHLVMPDRRVSGRSRLYRWPGFIIVVGWFFILAKIFAGRSKPANQVLKGHPRPILCF
jgi:hypothetical protein